MDIQLFVYIDFFFSKGDLLNIEAWLYFFRLSYWFFFISSYRKRENIKYIFTIFSHRFFDGIVIIELNICILTIKDIYNPHKQHISIRVIHIFSHFQIIYSFIIPLNSPIPPRTPLFSTYLSTPTSIKPSSNS